MIQMVVVVAFGEGREVGRSAAGQPGSQAGGRQQAACRQASRQAGRERRRGALLLETPSHRALRCGWQPGEEAGLCNVGKQVAVLFVHGVRACLVVFVHACTCTRTARTLASPTRQRIPMVSWC